MYKIVEKQTGVEWFAVGPDSVIVLTKGELNRPLNNLDLKSHLRDTSKDVKMSQFGLNLVFQEELGDAVVYCLVKNDVIFSSTDNPFYYGAGYGDLKGAGYIAVKCYMNDEHVMTQLINADTGSVEKEFPNPVIRKSDDGRYIYDMPLGGGNITRVDFDGKSLWTLVADNKDIKNTGTLGTYPNSLGNIIGEREGQLWYQEASGVVKAVNIETGKLELTLGEQESDLAGDRIQKEGEQLYGTFNYRFSKDKQFIHGMGGSIFTEIDLNAESPRRRVFNCRETVRKFGADFYSIGPYPERENQLIYCDRRRGTLGALDRSSKEVTWSFDLFPDRDPEQQWAGIREVVEHGNRLYILVKDEPTSTNGTLITLEQT